MLQKFNRLKQWLGINDDYMELREMPYRGVVAKRDIDANVMILCIEDDKLMDNRCFTQLKKYNEYKDKIRSINSFVTLYLLEHFNDTKWKPYTDMLPENLEESWYYMNDTVCELIRHTKVAEKISDFKKSRFDDDLSVLESDAYFPELRDPVYRDKWCRTKLYVNSRIFGYNKNGVYYSGMVPMADMLNHASSPNCDWYYDNSINKFCMKTNVAIGRGSELLDSYGDKESVRFYLLYGFIPKELETVNDMSVSLDKTELCYNTDVKSLLSKYGCYDVLFSKLVSKFNGLPTKQQLTEAGAHNNVVVLIGHEKNIMKRLIRNAWREMNKQKYNL